VLRYNPHALTEGIAIAGHATGAAVGHNDIRGELMDEPVPRFDRGIAVQATWDQAFPRHYIGSGRRQTWRWRDMAHEVLQFVALTSGGRAFDIEFPLHPQTQSAPAVSDLVTHLLAVISGHAKDRTDLSDGDILQALAMTSAIRGRMLEGDQADIADLNRLLHEQAWLAVRAAKSYAAARA
jgi:hypothetical protein